VSSLDELAAELLGTLGNAGLKLDPLSEPRLKELEGNTVRFEIRVPGAERPIRVRLAVARSSLDFSLDDESPANAVIRGTLPDMLAWLTGRAAPGLSFTGDDALLTRLGAVFEQFQPDLAQPLDRLIGPDRSAAVLGFAEAALATARSALQAVADAAGTTARERFADSSEFDSVVESLEALQLKADRLGARVARLEALRPASGGR